MSGRMGRRRMRYNPLSVSTTPLYRPSFRAAQARSNSFPHHAGPEETALWVG